MSKMFKAFLRKTCISKLPVEVIQEKGTAYVATVSVNPGELDMIPFSRWDELCMEWAKISDIQSLQERKQVRDIFAYAVEYRIEDDGSTLYTPTTSLLGEPGDKLEVFWNEDRWTIRKIRKQNEA